MEATQRALVRGPTFIRLLARLTEADVPPSHPSLADRLSQWIDWTRAVALSRVLDDAPKAPTFGGPGFDDIEDLACVRTRRSLAETISAGPPVLASGDPLDFAPLRQHYVAMQRAMQIATGQLRGRLRDMLPGLSVDMARLADVDALMELVLSPREHALLAAVPTLLGEHFERQRAAAQAVAEDGALDGAVDSAMPSQATPAGDDATGSAEDQAVELDAANGGSPADGNPVDAGPADTGSDANAGASAPASATPSRATTTPAVSTAWLDTFHRDMQAVLHAELDVRFLPIEALLAALRSHSQGRHVQTSA